MQQVNQWLFEAGTRVGLTADGSKEILQLAAAYGIHLLSHYMYVKYVGARADQFHFHEGYDGRRDRHVRQ